MPDNKRIAIIGGGICGLTAAYISTRKGYETNLYEKCNRVGGLLRSFSTGKDSLEMFYHHNFPSDESLKTLAQELDINAKFLKYRPKSGYYLEQPHNLSTPINFALFKGLSFFNRIKVSLFLLRVKRISNTGKYDEISASDWIRKKVGDKPFDDFFYPLLNSKFGSNWENVSAAWLISRIQLRANTSLRGELLIYPQGGYSVLIDSLVSWLEKNGCKIHRNHSLKSISLSEDENELTSMHILDLKNNEIKQIFADHYILTIPPNFLKQKCPNSQLETDLAKFPFQGALIVIISLFKSASDIYWLNIKPRKRFGAIIEHTNLIESKNYGGDIIFYLASYPDLNEEIWKKNDEEIIELYFEDLKTLFPHLSSQVPKWTKVIRTKYAGPLYCRGYLSILKEFSAFRENFSMVGTFRSYPERTIEDSIKQAYEWQKTFINTNK